VSGVVLHKSELFMSSVLGSLPSQTLASRSPIVADATSSRKESFTLSIKTKSVESNGLAYGVHIVTLLGIFGEIIVELITLKRMKWIVCDVASHYG
jgi:hypothetical protein